MPTRKQLAAQLAALNAKTATDVAAAQAEIDTTNAVINQPYEEEFPTGFPNISEDNENVQELPAGFTPGPFPAEFVKFFGEPPANIMGWKLDQKTDTKGRTYYQLSISEKGAYGMAKSGSLTYGAWLAKDANGNWTTANMDDSGGGKGGTQGNITGALTATDGKTFTNYSDYVTYQAKLDSEKSARQSAYDLLYSQFKQYGLESLVEGIKGLIQENVSPSEFAIRLQDTDAYKKRFAANQDRIKQGLRALTPAEYIGLEDQYQNIMRNYGLPASYWSKDSMGTQAGFNKFIANDVSAAELEDRIATAQKRVINADVNVINALKQFYPDITNADILAYTLDPTNALENIKRKVTAAEIGGAALGQGLATSAASAEDLAKYGITKAQAQQGYGTIAEFLPSATKLGDIYAGQGLGAYDQATAEQEVFGTAGAAEAARKRKKLSELERATFGGQAGQAQGALARDRAGSI